MDRATILWIAGTAIVVITAIAVFAGRIIYERRQERKEEIGQKLTTHFEDINRKVIGRISEMSRGLAIRNNRLVYGAISPVKEHYPFESDDNYLSFQIHFPEEAKEWKRLNRDAIECNGKLVEFFQRHNDISAQTKANEFLGPLQQNFSNLAKTLADKVETISKYQIGKTFRHNKKCPICKKF